MNSRHRYSTRSTLRLATLAAAVLAYLPARSFAQAADAQMIDPSRIVAVVNGEEIKGAEYYGRMELLPGIGSIVGKSFIERQPRTLTIQKLINERMFFALAKLKGVLPSDNDIQVELELRKQDDPKLIDNYIAAGGSVEEFKYELKVQLAELNLKTFGVNKNEKDAEAFYNDHPLLYTTSPSLKLRLIALRSSDDTKIVDQELASGKSFADEAKERSIDVSKSSGGSVGTVFEDKLSPETREALKNVKVGGTTSWLTTAANGGTGVYIKFYVEDIVPGKKQELTPKLKRAIRRKLMLDIGHIKNANLAKELEALRADSKIEFKPPTSSLPNVRVDPSRTILIVNGEEIKGAEYYRRMEYLPGVGLRVANSFTEIPPGFITIRQLILEHVTVGLAKDLGAYPSDDEVTAEFSYRKQKDPKMLEDWLAGGGSQDELKFLVAVDLARFKAQTFGVTITDTEVENYYKSNHDLYKEQKQYKLRMIEVDSDEEKKLVDSDLSAGKRFDDVAKERSIDASKLIGGQLGTIPESKIDTAFRSTIQSTKIGNTSDWATIEKYVVETKDGTTKTYPLNHYYKFLLEDVIAQKQQDLDSDLRRRIRADLMFKRGVDKNGSLDVQVDQKLSKSKIDIKQPEFASAYQQYLSSHMKQRGIN